MMTGNPDNRTQMLDRKVLELLVCPVTKQPLSYDSERQELISRAARLAYPIRNGIPVMLAEEARALDEVPDGVSGLFQESQ